MSRKRTNRSTPKGLAVEPLESRELLTVNMTPQEQLFLELVNRARADPLAEVRRNPDVFDLNEEVEADRLISTDPKQPLAPHQALVDAMVFHVDDMLERNYFGHDSPDGTDPSDRAKTAGYPVGAGENIAWSGNTRSINQDEEVYLRHQGLFDSVGHRVNMMRESWREIGPGIRYGSFTNDESTVFQASIMAGTLFGNRGGDYFITGVAINDQVSANNFYEIGEGIGNVLITAVNNETSEVYSVRTGSSGGYGLQVPNGIYSLTATGGRLTRPLTVRGVRVDDANMKVDFNSRSMNTRYVEGRVFEDANANGRRDSGEQTLEDRTVYLDLNENGTLDTGEPSERADSTGLFRIDGLLPTEYTVRQVIDKGWEPTSSRTFAVNLQARNIVGVDFGLQRANLPPESLHDFASVVAGEEIAVEVLGNDSDPEDELDRNSIRITSLPQNGLASVRGTRVFYRANESFMGSDTFTYTVDDTAGRSSNIARVTINVTSSTPWQNPVEPLDVDGDAVIAPRDALQLITEINSVGSYSLDNVNRTAESPYFDVSGDNSLSPIDVLFVFAYLNEQNTSGSAEPPAQDAADVLFAMPADTDEDDDPLARLT